MKTWWKSVKTAIRRKYYFYKIMSPFYKLLLQLKFIIIKLKLRLLIDKLIYWRHFPIAGSLLASIIYCLFAGFEYLPACIMGLGFCMWYDYYKHPDISRLKSFFALALLILAYIAITIIMISRKLYRNQL